MTLARDLAPVSEALLETARLRALQVRENAEDDARAEQARALVEVDRVVTQARSRGEWAAQRITSLELAAARREAHEMVLDARRRAYESLRNGAVEALVRFSSTPEGRVLVELLSQLVVGRLGAGASLGAGRSDAMLVRAESGNRRCAVSADMLVDEALRSMPEKVEALWR